MNYNYYNPNPSYYGGGPSYAAMPQVQYPYQSSQQVPTLNGKVVDSVDVARATEVPIGGYGIFPKADLSEIYVKSWNNNGTTSIIVFKPAEASPMVTDNGFPRILERLDTLESKIDNLNLIPQQQASIKKVEVNTSEY